MTLDNMKGNSKMLDYITAKPWRIVLVWLLAGLIVGLAWMGF